MSRKLTQEQFIERFKAVHGDRYGLGKAVYVTGHKKVIIQCAEHGDFEATPTDLTSGKGCKKCGNKRSGQTRRISKEELIERGTALHSGRYTYNNADCTSQNPKVSITCTECNNDFMMKPEAHLGTHKQGCRVCASRKNGLSKRMTREEFIEKATTLYGSKYDYSDIDYKGRELPIKLFCNVHNGYYDTTPKSHLSGRFCSQCSSIIGGAKIRGNTERFITSSIARFGNKFIYTKTKYVTSNQKLLLTCAKHLNDFLITPCSHLSERSQGGCPECAADVKIAASRKSHEEFLMDARSAHGLFYNYSEDTYKSRGTKMKIICPYHGAFWQTPDSHTQGRGCPDCKNSGYKSSKPGHLYVLVSDDITKVGITNKDPKVRCKYITKDSGKDFTVLKSYRFDVGQVALDLETVLLQELRKQYKSPTEKFSGSTECFYDVNQATLLNRIEEYSTQIEKLAA